MRAGRIVALVFLFSGLLPLGAATPTACAAEGPSAVLVVDTEAPGGQLRYCVAMPDGSVTGIELIELAGAQHGLQYRFGYGGNVVCQLAGVGYASDECLKDGPEFWGYWRGDGSGGWDWSSTGGHATVVRDGDVEGWSWGTGNDGSSHPAPPGTTFASVCGAPSGSDGGSKGDGGKERGARGDPNEGDSGKGTDASASVPSTADQAKAAEQVRGSRRAGKDEPRGSDKERDRNRGRSNGGDDRASDDASPTPSATAAPVPATRPASAEGSGGTGPPVGGLVAAAAAAVCIAAAVFLQRRRAGPTK